MDLVNVICEGSMKATVNIVRQKELVIDADKVWDALRDVVLTGYPELLEQELKPALESNMGEQIYKALINAACYDFALRALRKTQYIS